MELKDIQDALTAPIKQYGFNCDWFKVFFFLIFQKIVSNPKGGAGLVSIYDAVPIG